MNEDKQVNTCKYKLPIDLEASVVYYSIEARMERENCKYVEIELRQMDEEDGQQILVVVRDLSRILKSQQRKIDDNYQEAIEANYSHEQMTPLNCIIGSSNIALMQFREKFEELQMVPKVAQEPSKLISENQ